MLRIVFCSENTEYMGWQAAVAAHNCSRFGWRPTVYTHGPADRPLSRGHQLAARFADVVRLPLARRTAGGRDYAPRHTPATLAAAAAGSAPGDLIVLCDPDVLFFGAVDFRPWQAAPCAYLAAAPPGFRCGVPYCVPAAAAAPLAARWLAATDARVDAPGWSLATDYVAVMHALADAGAALGHAFEPTLPVETNFADDTPAKLVLHYCYGTPAWDKKAVGDAVWETRPVGRPGSVLNVLTASVHRAAVAYGLAEPAAPAAAPPGEVPLVFDKPWDYLLKGWEPFLRAGTYLVEHGPAPDANHVRRVERIARLAAELADRCRAAARPGGGR